jgi:hypothetical protein
VEVLNLAWRSGLCIQGSDALPWGSGPTVATLEYIVSSGHVAAPEPPMWRGQVLFIMRLEIAAWALCLHTVVRGTPNLGYRQRTLRSFKTTTSSSYLSGPPIELTLIGGYMGATVIV